MRYLTLFIAAAFLSGCVEKPRGVKTVAAVGSCTVGTGGWGGQTAKCRVTFTDGTRGTAEAPVDVGDECAFIIGVWVPKHN